MTTLPDAPATGRNREPILAALRAHLDPRAQVLEIGSGTGQHAVHFGAALPGVRWQTSDLAENHPGIRSWLAHAALPNVLPPLTLDAASGPWPTRRYDAVYTANTLHIMGWPQVQALFARLPQLLSPDGQLFVYGPFHIGGRPTAPSNAAFDAWLRGEDPARGVRDFEAVQALAADAGLRSEADIEMPANNRLLVWRRSAAPDG